MEAPVHELLADPATRAAALDALEAAPPAGVEAQRAARALVEHSMLTETDATTYRRAGLLVARLISEAEDLAAADAVFGAAVGDGLFVPLTKGGTAGGNALECLQKPVEQLTELDALT
jgi:hypothetical protein